MTRIVELGGELKEAQAKAALSQQEPSGDPTPVSAEQTAVAEAAEAAPAAPAPAAPASDEVEKLKEELAAVKKEVEDLRARAEKAEAEKAEAEKAQATNQEKPAVAEAQPSEEQLNATKALLEEREARVAQLEATLQQREAKVSNREGKQAQFQEKCNNKIKEIRALSNEELERLKAEHQAEIERIRQTQVAPANNSSATQSAPTQSEDMFAGATSDTPIDTESLPRPTATLQQFSAFVKSNNGVKHLLQGLVAKNVEAKTRELTKQVTDLKQALKALNSEPAPTPGVKQESTNGGSEEVANIKAEHEKALKAALEQKEASLTRAFKLKSKLFEGQFSLLKVRWAVFEKAAKATPTEEVGKVYEIAKVAKDTPAAQPNTPSKPQPPTPGQLQTPSQAAAPGQQQQTPAGATGTSQMNGATSSTPSHAQAMQPTPGQQPNPFQQTGQGVAAPNPFASAQNQMGRGVGGNSSITAPNQQQAGRGRGENVGTGPRALQGLIGTQGVQSGIPRGGLGSGIPVPGGRGGGRGQAQPGTGIPQLGGPTQGIPRGGGRGAGRGAGRGQNSAQPSPRTSLNPGAAGFQPVGAGRGQKRNAEDDAEGGGARGGKRARGGRGGAGGGGAPAAGGE
jgi:nucleoprotein TPR